MSYYPSPIDGAQDLHEILMDRRCPGMKTLCIGGAAFLGYQIRTELKLALRKGLVASTVGKTGLTFLWLTIFISRSSLNALFAYVSF